MLIIAVDESEKNSLIKSRRVLGKYLFQHGHSTYAGHLSMEGLDELTKELKSSASKNTAIGIFVTGKSKGIEIVRTIGRSSQFSPEGLHVHKTRSLKVLIDEFPKLTSTQKILRLILRMAALFHDIGKASVQFQRKLRGSSKHAERIRHELLSYLILEKWYDDLADPLSWLEALKNSEKPLSSGVDKNHQANINPRLIEVFESNEINEMPSTHEALNALTKRAKDNPLSNDPIFGAVSWLVLTHHKMIASDHDNNITPSLIGAQINVYECPWNPENLQMVESGLPWDDESWCAQVKACATQIQRVINDNPGIIERLTENKAAWTATLSTACRPYLVFSDYIGTLKKVAYAKPDKNDIKIAYANTIDKNGAPFLADSLALHLKKVRKAVDPVFSLCELSTKSILPCISSNQIPERSALKSIADTGSRFNWQYLGAQALKEQVPEVETRPGFIVLACGTGSGKTIGGVRILETASGGEIRFTAALGLRSLTLQTGYAYTDPAGMALPKTEVMTVVGDALYAKLNKKNDAKEAINGSECLDDDDLVILDNESDDHRKGSYLAKTLNLTETETSSLLSSQKTVAMTQVPVLVCTVDHLMKAAAPRGGSDTRMMLRLATADLILDEIDNYSSEDLVCLGRLIHTAGVHGRRVVLMSATVSETAIKALHQAWLSGLASFDQRREIKSQHYLCLIADKSPPVISNTPTLQESEICIDQFITGLIDSTPCEDQKNIGKVLCLDGSVEQALDTIVDKAFSLAKSFDTKDSKGRSLSVGVIRFNQVRGARELAQHLHAMELPEGVALKVVCYHRRMPLYNLTFIERHLNELLNRKDPDKIFENALVKPWMDSEKEKKNFVIIVCATSIQETGRDHDYDWGIAEPWSTRSFVQLAGRILRHRHKRSESSNVWLMSQALSQIRAGESKNVELSNSSENGPLPIIVSIIKSPALFKSATEVEKPHGIGQRATTPALMQVLSALGTHEAIQPVNPVFEGSCAFDIEGWSLGISAHHCLRATTVTKSPLTGLEHAMQYARMSGDEKWSLKKITSFPDAPLYNCHQTAVRFRRQSSKQVQLTLTPESNFKDPALVQRDRFGIVLHEAIFEKTELENPSRALIRLDLVNPHEDMLVPWAAKNKPGSLEAKLLYSFESYGQEETVFAGKPIVSFHPLLGADYPSTEKTGGI